MKKTPVQYDNMKNNVGVIHELPLQKNLPKLPEGWTSLTLDYIASNKKNSIKRGPFGSSIKKSFFVSSGYKVYEQKNVIYNDFKRGNYFINKKKFDELKDFEVKSGDILNNKIVNTRYFVYLLRSKITEILLESTRGSAMVNISSVKDLKQIAFPIPPPPEQHQIVSEIERRFSVADEVEKVVDNSLKQAERLKQSILKRAFEGKLVLQDPNDEPYDMKTAKIMFNNKRYIYAVFMCHLSIEKALKGLYAQKLHETPPKTHNLLYLVEKIKLELSEEMYDILFTLNGVSVPTRYPDEVKKMQKDYNKKKTKILIDKSKGALKWLKARL
jgi:type I restriction enzyme S subunit